MKCLGFVSAFRIVHFATLCSIEMPSPQTRRPNRHRSEVNRGYPRLSEPPRIFLFSAHCLGWTRFGRNAWPPGRWLMRKRHRMGFEVHSGNQRKGRKTQSRKDMGGDLVFRHSGFWFVHQSCFHESLFLCRLTRVIERLGSRSGANSCQ